MEEPWPILQIFQLVLARTRKAKHRRYSLLFAINGGAFAVAKLFGEKDAAPILGHLRLTQLAVGMAVLTAIIVIDIFMFGEKMRSMYLPNAFGWQGKAVLISIGATICIGWLLVAGVF